MEQKTSVQQHTPFILSLDVGTSSTRALLFAANGDAVPGIQAQETYELTLSNDGEVSVDADKLVAAVASTIDKALKAAGPLTFSIGAVATDTFWHSLVGVDTDGRPVTHVITWEDTRPRQAAAELSAQLDRRAVHERTGARLHASYWPAKLRFLAKTQPDAFSRAAQWLSFGEYLHRQLLGRSVCGLSMASGTGMLVIRERNWDRELMGVLGIRPEQLPQLGDFQDGIRGLRPEYAARWPALRDIPWYPALGDGAAANVGSGCAIMGNWALTIGTSSAMRAVVSPDKVVPPAGLWLYLVNGSSALLGGALSEGGNVFAWIEKTLQLPSLKYAEPQVAALLHTLPTRITGHGNSRRNRDLVLRKNHRHIIGAVLAVQLTSRHERIRLPPCAVVHCDLRVPLGEIPGTTAPTLTSRDGGWSRVPLAEPIFVSRLPRRSAVPSIALVPQGADYTPSR